MEGKKVITKMVVVKLKVSLGIPQQNLKDGRERFIPLGRAGTAEEAAGGILLLASPMAAYITGHCLEVTGGAGI